MLNFVLSFDGGSWRAKNVTKLSSKYLDGQNMQNQTIFQLYIDFSSRKDILKSEKIKKKGKKKKYTPSRQFPKLQLLNFLEKSLTERKCLIKSLTFARRKHRHL